jgi:glucosamine-6-phosphate deaminase
MGISLTHLHIFTLDEYVGVPVGDPRTCANLIRRTAAGPWGVPEDRYFWIEPDPASAASSIAAHEGRLAAAGGADVMVLGLGQNGHLGFNEPGSVEGSGARVLDLDPVSVEANRAWFSGEYAPGQGATLGMAAILAARRVLVVAYGLHKRDAVRAMVRGLRTPACPASLLQGHPSVHLVLDRDAASMLSR